MDKTGRTSAVIGFATATAGLIISIISLVEVVSSGGSTAITATEGIKLIIAGISILTEVAGTIQSGYDAVKTFKSTDSADIDWDNVDWKKVGISSAEKAIENTANGYMCGAITGVIHGGIEGYEHYQKYNTPYTQYEIRLKQTPKNKNGGKWSGNKGESDFILDEPIIRQDGTKIEKVTYKNAVPDFSYFQKAKVKIPNMTDDRTKNFSQADKILAEIWNKIKYNEKSWTANEVKTYRKENGLIWHEMNNMEYMQLVPSEVSQIFTHCGGVAEYNAMIGQNRKINDD